jgi:hypothetical protein
MQFVSWNVGVKNEKGRTSLPLSYSQATNYLEAAEAAEAEAEPEAFFAAAEAFLAEAEADAEPEAEADAEAGAEADAEAAKAEAANRPAIRAAITFFILMSFELTCL